MPEIACISSNYSRVIARVLGLQVRQLPMLISQTEMTIDQFLQEDTLLTSRQQIQILHNALEMTDEELFALEDLVADYVDLTMSVVDRIITRDMIYAMPSVDGVASKLDKLVGLSAAMAGDAAFARQARRKFL